MRTIVSRVMSHVLKHDHHASPGDDCNPSISRSIKSTEAFYRTYYFIYYRNMMYTDDKCSVNVWRAAVKDYQCIMTDLSV